MSSSKEILSDLEDNQGVLSHQGGFHLPDKDYDKGLLRLLANTSVKDLTSRHNLLVYPQSFDLGDGTSRVLGYDENDDIPDTVYTGNMIGFVGRNDTDIFIHSRFGSKENDYFPHYMLMKICGLNVFNFPTSIDITHDKIHDLLIYIFPMLLNKALAKGLLKTYIHKAYNDSNVRGKIDISRHIKRNKPFTGRMAYNVREYNADNVVTELIRHCIEHMQHSGIGRAILHCDKTTKNNIELIKKITPSYNAADRERIIAKNRKTPIHPLYAEYRPLQKLCMAILKNKRIDYGKGKNKVYGILFDGSFLWEEYVARVLGDKMIHRRSGDGKGTIYLFTDVTEGRGFQRIVPDYISLVKENVVADAKYIPLDGIGGMGAVQAASVYYKTIMYMYRFNSRKGFIFYPSSNGNLQRDFQIVGTERHIYMQGLKIAHTNSFKQFCDEMKKNEEEFMSSCNTRVAR